MDRLVFRWHVVRHSGTRKTPEAIEIKLTGELADTYDVYYRVHMQNIGWLGWARNGETSGSSGFAFRLEAIQIVLTAKGTSPDTNTCGVTPVVYSTYFTSTNTQALLDTGLINGWIDINGATRYVGGNHFFDGSVVINGINYLFVNSALQRNARLVVGNILYYTNSDGAVSRSVDGSRPMVALTFDDGPTELTRSILDTLETNHAVATFFVCGSSASSKTDILQREHSLGCQIGNHTYDHASLTRLSASAIQSELSSTDSVVQSAIGTPTSIMRPPGGAYNDKVRSAVNLPIITWSIDTRDWEHRSARRTVSAVLDHVKDGDIVLMHDRLTSTVTACRTIVPTLINRGYQLVTIEEIAMFRGGMSAGTVYWRFR